MKLSFHGAAREVTGSCCLLTVNDAEWKERRLLIDCGMFQGERLCGSKNFEAFGFDPKTVDAVYVTHPHADPTGRLPKLVREGYAGSITMTQPCKALTKIVLEDAFHIMEENAKKCGDRGFYGEEDLEGPVPPKRGGGGKKSGGGGAGRGGGGPITKRARPPRAWRRAVHPGFFSP